MNFRARKHPTPARAQSLAGYPQIGRIGRKRDTTATFVHPNKQLLVDAYGRILGIPADNLVWSYLNKGTHEEADRDDFDGDLVEQVVQTLEALDALDLRNGR